MSKLTDAAAEYAPSSGHIEVLTITDPKGQAIFDALPDEAKEHLRRFGLARPGFDIVLHGNMAFDEHPMKPGERTVNVHRMDPLHQYQAGTIYTVGKLRLMPRTRLKVLDVGSPIEQNLAVAALDGVELTVVDVRPSWRPDILPFQSLQASVTTMPLEDGVADVITSNCVLCHVGDGRYGDAFDVDGDVKMLRECKRVLKKGGLMIIGVGPVHKTANILFNVHRVYSPEWLTKLFTWAGLRATDMLAYDLFTGSWITMDLLDGKTRGQFYGFVTLEKPVW